MSKRGFVLLATALTIIALAGLAGVAVDIGRMYVTRTEAQAYTDSAALAAARELDGSSAGIDRAIQAAGRSAAKWNLGNSLFPTPTVDFAPSLAGPWMSQPSSAANYTHARVRTSVSVPLYLLPATLSSTHGAVSGSAVAAQVQKTAFSQGIFPFSPFAHNSTPPDYGLTPGQQYTLRWASNPRLGGRNVCPGDQSQAVIDIAQAQGGSERGFIEDSSAASIRAAIQDDYQTVFRQVGDIINMTGGAKQSQLTSLENRILQDTDTTSLTIANYHGNGRRLIVAPINDGGSPPGVNPRLLTFAAFLLLPTGEYGNGANQAWCALYVGAWVQGLSHQGAGAPGAYVLRLVQ